MLVKNDLFDYLNRYIYQDSDYFKFSLDSILLAEYTKLKKNDIVLDMCTGNAAIPLILSTKFNNKITAFEIQNEVYNLAKMSVESNSLDDQISLINDDIKNIGNYFQKESFNVIVCNPPYFKVASQNFLNKNTILSKARHEECLTLDKVFAISSTFVKNKGSLFLVHRANRIDDIIILANKYNINVKEIQFVCTKSNLDPKIVLVKCIKGSKCGTIIKKDICIENIKTYQNLFKE